jgi:hypothetical protein
MGFSDCIKTAVLVQSSRGALVPGINRCFQVGKFSRKVRYGKIGRGRRPISAVRGNIIRIWVLIFRKEAAICDFSAAWFSK